jgi:molecular chaperone GrpE
MAKKHSLKELEQQIGELTEALQRERADAVNMRRRYDEQVTSLNTTVKAGVVRDLLPVIDNFERALKHIPKDIANHDYVKGVQGSVKQFEKTLSDIGVHRIKTEGEVFDPMYHEAIGMDQSPEASDQQEDAQDLIEVVSEELAPGYVLGDEVIRHAMVKVRMQPSQKLEDRSSKIEDNGGKNEAE